MMELSKQEHRVLNHLEQFGYITRLDAMLTLGIANLTAVIANLRNIRGIGIVTQTMHTKNRYGEPVSYARYVLPENYQSETVIHH